MKGIQLIKSKLAVAELIKSGIWKSNKYVFLTLRNKLQEVCKGDMEQMKMVATPEFVEVMQGNIWGYPFQTVSLDKIKMPHM